jgi:hypothetical protein
MRARFWALLAFALCLGACADLWGFGDVTVGTDGGVASDATAGTGSGSSSTGTASGLSSGVSAGIANGSGSGSGSGSGPGSGLSSGMTSGIASGAASGTSASGGGSGSGSGETGADGGACVRVPVMPANGGPACPMGDSGCYPQDVTAFGPNWVPPLGHNLGLCTTAQIADYWGQCLGSTQSASCPNWPTENAGCYACLVTPSSASHWGALVAYGTTMPALSPNIGGCIALAEPCNLACASDVEAAQQCENAACNPSSGVCSVTDANSYASYMACINQATTQATGGCGCEGYYKSTNCVGTMAESLAEHPALGTCYGPVASQVAAGGSWTFQQSFQPMATYMCGP